MKISNKIRNSAENSLKDNDLSEMKMDIKNPLIPSIRFLLLKNE